MSHVLFGNPSIPHGVATMTEGEIVAFLVTVSVFIVIMAIASVILGVAGRMRSQRLSQMKEAPHLEAPRNPQGEREPQTAPQQDKKESLVRIPSLT